MAQCGWDSITVDLQHGVQDYLSMVACFQAMHAHPVTRLARVPWNEPGIIGKVLDGGAYGVICPMINTRQQCEALGFMWGGRAAWRRKRTEVLFCVSSLRLPLPTEGHSEQRPNPRRGVWRPRRVPEDRQRRNLGHPMIETQEALDNLEAILDVPGIDGIYVGPGDLSFSLGLVPRLDREEPQVLQIYERLIRETNNRGLYAGLHCASPVYAARMICSGFRLVTIANDSGLLAKAASESVAGVWAEAGDFR